MRHPPLPLVLACTALLAGCAGWHPPGAQAEARVTAFHAEDDQVRIEEQRVRGQLTRAVVSPKAEGASAYEVLTPPGGQDPSKNRDAAGQRVWNVLTF